METERQRQHHWWHVGDLAWAVREGAHLELGVWVRLWHDVDGDLAGWTWIRRQRSADVCVVPGPRDPRLLDDMLAALEEVALRTVAAGDPVEQMSVDAAQAVAVAQRDGVLDDDLGRRAQPIAP